MFWQHFKAESGANVAALYAKRCFSVCLKVSSLETRSTKVSRLFIVFINIFFCYLAWIDNLRLYIEFHF